MNFGATPRRKGIGKVGASAPFSFLVKSFQRTPFYGGLLVIFVGVVAI
jgi:hypothetical protein